MKTIILVICWLMFNPVQLHKPNSQKSNYTIKDFKTPLTEYFIVKSEDGGIDTILNLISNSPKDSVRYTWKGKFVTYKVYRDSLKSEYLKFCDSIQRK